MMGPIAKILAALESRDRKPKKSGDGKWQAKCPAHDDKHPSLSVAEGKDGRALLKCQAGCELEEVVSALNLEKRDLFPAEDASSSRHIVKVYPYTDKTGALLYEVVRFEPKDFRQRQPDGVGGYRWNMKDARRVLYRLPTVVAALKTGATIWIVEGEKDADNLTELGLTATTSVMGAGKWRPEYAEQLRGASRVVIIPDNDEPGRKHADQVARSLAGIVSELRIVELPGPGKDVSDWLTASGTREELERFADDAPASLAEKRGHSARDGDLPGRAVEPRRTAEEGEQERTTLKGTNLHELSALLESSEHADLICGGDLEFDEMNLAPSVGGVPFDEAKYLDVQRRIEQFYSGPRGGSLHVAKDRVRDAIHLAAVKRSRHPVREFLQQLKWDGVERIGSVLEDILGIEPTELSQAIIRAWFISAVARPLQPGCKVDHVLILVGPQNLGKSSFFVQLVGTKWFSDSVIDIQNRDSYLLLRRVWILEWSELEAMQRARHQDSVKAFITSCVELFRAPYARAIEAVPRTCVIVGTTNAEGFLTDATGNRRYWPIRVGKLIDLEKLAEVRDQLWAEAVVAFQKGEHGQWSRSDEMRVASILKREGWVNRQVRVGPDRLRKWFAPTDGRGMDGVLGQKSLLVSMLAHPSQGSHPIYEEEEEEVTARARGGKGALQGLSGDDRVLAETVGTSRRVQ